MELMIFIVIGSLAGIFEVPRLIKKKLYKDLFVFLFLLSTSLGLGIMESADFPLPSPAKVIEIIVSQFVNVKFGYQ